MKINCDIVKNDNYNNKQNFFMNHYTNWTYFAIITCLLLDTLAQKTYYWVGQPYIWRL